MRRNVELGEREAEIIRDARDVLAATQQPGASDLAYLVQFENLRFALADLLDLLDGEPAHRASA